MYKSLLTLDIFDTHSWRDRLRSERQLQTCLCIVAPPPSHPPLCLLHYIFNWQVLLPAVSFSCCHFQCISPSFSLSPTALICETTAEHSTSANYCREDFSRYFNSCFLLPSSGNKWRAPLSRTPRHILGKSVKSRKLLQWVVWLWHQQCLKSPSEQK